VEDSQAQLEWEARMGRWAGIAAFVAVAFVVAALLYRIAALPHGANNVREFLPEVHAHESQFLISGILTALAMLAFVPPLLYLFWVTRARREELPPVARILLFLGAILFAVCAVWFQLRQAHAADQFVAGTVKTKKHAEDLLRSATTAVAAFSLAASIASGLATILISLNAMRAGLLSRFMGVLGIILGALFVLPLIASPVIQLFWLAALGALFLGIWPGGRGPAWTTGKAVPWPSTQRRLAPAAAGGESQAAMEAPVEPGNGDAPAPATATQRKRKKRKARR
jgi:hypothetical protein